MTDTPDQLPELPALPDSLPARDGDLLAGLLQTLTPGGLPYPASSDPANQGANDIKALALALEARGAGKWVQSGYSNVTYTSGNASVTFPTPFKAGSTPVVLAMPIYGAGQFQEAGVAMMRAPTATGFQSTMYQVSGAPGWFSGLGTLMWIAIGVI